MQTTIRNYIVKEKEDKGSFPDIPDEEDGGSKFIFFPPDANEENAENDSGKVHNLFNSSERPRPQLSTFLVFSAFSNYKTPVQNYNFIKEFPTRS